MHRHVQIGRENRDEQENQSSRQRGPAPHQQQRAKSDFRKPAQAHQREMPGEIRRHDAHIDGRIDEMVHPQQDEQRAEDVPRNELGAGHLTSPMVSATPPRRRGNHPKADDEHVPAVAGRPPLRGGRRNVAHDQHDGCADHARSGHLTNSAFRLASAPCALAARVRRRATASLPGGPQPLD